MKSLRKIKDGVPVYRVFPLMGAIVAILLARGWAAQVPVPVSCSVTTGCPQDRFHNIPTNPFHLIGNIYWVGLSDQTSYLMTTPQGNILLDTTSEETAPWVRQNIEKLGFKVKDIKIIMTTHAHGPHVGGFAQFKELTGAKIVAPAGDVSLLEDGGRSDPDAGRDADTFPPIKPDRVVGDGDKVTLGDFTLVAHLTPGHTKGCTTWTTVVEDGGKKYDVVFMCPPQVGVLNNPQYPNREEDFEKTFKVLESLHCDVFLSVRSTMFKREEKQKRLEASEQPNPFIDPTGYRDSVSEYKQRFHDLQAKELTKAR